MANIMFWARPLLRWLANNPGAVVGSLALFWGIPTYVITRNAALYSSFDGLYQSALQCAVANGALRNPAKTQQYQTLDPDQKAAYETYAYMVFNVCETIADGLDFYRRHKWSVLELMEPFIRSVFPAVPDRKSLRKTWHPILVAEKQLHSTWLNQQHAGLRFKEEFLELMKGIENKTY